jgi:hypothetical protein
MGRDELPGGGDDAEVMGGSEDDAVFGDLGNDRVISGLATTGSSVATGPSLGASEASAPFQRGGVARTPQAA